MSLARVKNWIAETLTFSDLNAEFNNILNNPSSLITPITFHLTFTDATYDIGASGATRPRNLYLSGTATVDTIVSAATTATVFHTVATTVNFAGAASVALNIGNASAAAAFPGGISIPTGKAITGAGTAKLILPSQGTGTLIVGDASFADGIMNLYGNVNTANMFAIKTSTNGTGGYYMLFENAAGSIIGNIKQGSDTTTAFNTSSDSRLKNDLGAATSIDVLKNTVVHDHTWKSTGQKDLNVFAQEAYLVKPLAVSVGSDERTESGELKNPWSVDYSKYVPDLIVGWQNHEARLKALEAK